MGGVSPRSASSSRRPGAVPAVVALLAAHNVAVNELAPDAAYVPLNLTTTGVLLGIARADLGGLAPAGLARARLPAGARVGGRLGVLVTAGIAAAALAPPTRSWFEDERVAALGAAGLAFQVLVRIPLGTVVLEEVAFRGVLPALLERRIGPRGAVAASAALFGLWHVLPTLSALEMNDLASGTGRRALLVGAAVVGTGLGGVALSWLRRRAGSLAAPALVHWAANGTATIAAAIVLGQR